MDLRWREGLLAKVAGLVPEVIVGDGDEPALLTNEPVLNCKPFVAGVAALLKVQRATAIPQREVVEELERGQERPR